MRNAGLALVVMILAMTLVIVAGCASPMRVTTTPPGADITVDGKPVGKSPVTTEVPSGGPPVSVKAKIGDKEVTKSVARDGTNWGAVGAGAGAGVGTFCASWACSAGIGLFVPPLAIATIPIGCLGCASLVGMPAGAYFMWGATPPEQVTLDVGTAVAPNLPSLPPPEAVAPADATTPGGATPPPPPPPEPLPY